MYVGKQDPGRDRQWGVLQGGLLLEASNAAQPYFVWQAWHFVTFKTCQKTFCATSAILLHRFQMMKFIFRGKRSTLEFSIHHFAWQAQHFRRVASRVFGKLPCQGCIKW